MTWAALILVVFMSAPGELTWCEVWIERPKCGGVIRMGPVRMNADRVEVNRWKRGNPEWKVAAWTCREGLET